MAPPRAGRAVSAPAAVRGRVLAVPVRDAGGNHVAGINVILQGRLVSREEMAERFYHPLQNAALELGSLLLP